MPAGHLKDLEGTVIVCNAWPIYSRYLLPTSETVQRALQVLRCVFVQSMCHDLLHNATYNHIYNQNHYIYIYVNVTSTEEGLFTPLWA